MIPLKIPPEAIQKDTQPLQGIPVVAHYPVVTVGPQHPQYQATPPIYHFISPKTKNYDALDQTQISELGSLQAAGFQAVVTEAPPLQASQSEQLPSGWTSRTRIPLMVETALCGGYRNLMAILAKALCNPMAACVLVLKIVATAIGVAMIIVGSLHIDDCPKQRFIPIYLIVGGIIGLLRLNVQVVHYEIKPASRKQPDRPQGIDLSINVFLAAWLIVGMSWVYPAFVPSFQKLDEEKKPNPDYCHFGVYWLAFVAVTMQLGLAVLIISGIICFATINSCCKQGNANRK